MKQADIYFSFLTLFPCLIEGYFQDSILKKAIDSNIVNIEICNYRSFSKNKFSKIDEYQIGGGAGLVIDYMPIYEAIMNIKHKNPHAYTIFLQPVGKRFNYLDSKRLAQKKHLILVCGRYEGIDERAIELCADEVLSIGDFILTGGELAALVLCDSICRHVFGVLGNELSLHGESFEGHLLESPNFSRSKDNSKGVFTPPSEYSKGNHAKIKGLREKMSVAKTKYYRPDLYEKYNMLKGIK